jgi:hypothetical protein
VQWRRGEWRAPWQSLLPVASAFVVAALLAAPQLLPLLEVVASSQRVALADSYTRGPPLVDPLSSTLLATLQAFPALAAFLFIGAWQRRARGALALYLFVLVTAAGGWQLLRLLPGFSIARFGTTWALFVPFFAAWLSAIGVARFAESLEQEAEGRRVRRFALLCMWGLIGAAGWHLVAGGAETEWSLETFGPANLGAALCVAAGLAFIAVVGLRRRLPRSALAGGLALAMFAQMAALPFWTTMIPIELLPDPDAMAERSAATQAGRSVSIENLQYGHTLVDGIESLFGMEISMMPWRYRALYAHFDHNLLMNTTDWERLAEARGFLDATDVQYLVAPKLIGKKLRPHGLKRVEAGPGQMAVFENTDRMGRAWVSYGARVVESAEAARDYVLSPEFEPGSEVILERAPAGRYPERALHPATPAQVERTSTDRLRVRATLPRPGLLVVSEAGAKGWHVRVDGEPAAWLQADYLLRAVELDAGEHVVLFEYRPRSWRPSLIACVAGTGALLGLGIHARRAPKGARQEPPQNHSGDISA